MKIHTSGKTLETLNLRKHAKPIVLCLSALFITSMVAGFTVTSVHAATTMLPVHTSGDQILDSNGNVVYLRGVGIAGMAPDLILWGNNGSDSWTAQWQSASSTSVTQTFQELSTVWHVNMIRIFMYPEWWWLNGANGTANGENVQNYIKTLASEAEQYGIYVDIVPYQLTAYKGSFSSDPYLSTNMAGSQGLPLMNDWDSAAQSFLSSTGLSEQSFWTQFWTSMANTLKAYPNVIFEAWNEPSGSTANTIPTGYLTYLTIMYNAIRSTGSTNLIMMQWMPGWLPNCGLSLSWASQINTALGGNPTNIVYTTHFYYYSPSDDSSYWNQGGTSSKSGGAPMTTAQLETQLQSMQKSMGVSAPLVVNEEGSCLSSSSNKQNDYTWFSNILQAQNALDIGAGAYYWLSGNGLGVTYGGEYLLSSGYSPANMGQDYINAYTAPAATTLIPTPTQTPTASTPKPSTSNIIASSSDGGSISPSGTVSVNDGSNVTFTITPNSGFQIASVTINGTSIGTVSTYTFTNVTDAQTIVATFASNKPTTASDQSSSLSTLSLSPAPTPLTPTSSQQPLLSSHSHRVHQQQDNTVKHGLSRGTHSSKSTNLIGALQTMSLGDSGLLWV